MTNPSNPSKTRNPNKTSKPAVEVERLVRFLADLELRLEGGRYPVVRTPRSPSPSRASNEFRPAAVRQALKAGLVERVDSMDQPGFATLCLTDEGWAWLTDKFHAV